MQYALTVDPNDIEKSDWADFVRSHPKGNIFQSSQYYDAIKRTALLRPCFFCVTDSEKNVQAILVAVIYKESKGLVGMLSSRSIVHGGPLVANDDPEVLRVILEGYKKHIERKVIYSQFRNTWVQSFEKTIFADLEIRYEDHLDIFVDLKKGEEQLWKEVHSKRRNEIRRASKEGTTFRPAQSEEDFHEAYSILKEVYERVSIPLLKQSEFQVIYEELRKEKLIHCFLAENDNQIIGTMITLTFQNSIFDWYAGARSAFYKKYPNDLIPWEVFKWGMANGYSEFDFGGAGKPDQKYGVRDYKLKFGGELVTTGRYEIVHKKLMMMIGKLGYYILRRF